MGTVRPGKGAPRLILLYKKGDEKVPSNRKPISLQNALYRFSLQNALIKKEKIVLGHCVYAAVWAKRLAVWATEAGAIS